jgi:hypothetical protein
MAGQSRSTTEGVKQMKLTAIAWLVFATAGSLAAADNPAHAAGHLCAPVSIDGEVLAESTRRYLAQPCHHRQTVETARPNYEAPNGYRVASQFERVKAYCEALSDQAHPPVFAAPQTYGEDAAYLGAMIAGWAGHARTYNQCMTFHGYAQ